MKLEVKSLHLVLTDSESMDLVISFYQRFTSSHSFPSGSDIDTLCVAPKHIQREDFFTEMFELLKARPEVTELASVTEAYVPVLTFDFSGISIDLL